MSDYTPTTEEIIEYWSAVRGQAVDPDARDRHLARAEMFRRWLAAVRAEWEAERSRADAAASMSAFDDGHATGYAEGHAAALAEQGEPSGEGDVLRSIRLYCENQGDKFRYHAGRILGMMSALGDGDRDDPSGVQGESAVVRRNEWSDGSYQKVYADGSTGPWEQGEPTTDEWEARASFVGARLAENGYAVPRNEVLLALANWEALRAPLHRTVQVEPNQHIVMCARCGLFPVIASDELNTDIVLCDRCAFAQGRESVQGEPSDATVRVVAQHMAHAASDWTDIEGGQHEHGMNCTNWTEYTADARAALRAVTEGMNGNDGREPLARARELAVTAVYNAVTGADGEDWGPDATLTALQKLWDVAAASCPTEQVNAAVHEAVSAERKAIASLLMALGDRMSGEGTQAGYYAAAHEVRERERAAVEAEARSE